MIDTKKPVRFYNAKLPVKDRVYFIMDSITTENGHVFACNTKGELDTHFLFNKVTHSCFNAAYKDWVVENYEIPKFPDPETKFTNALEPLTVNFDLLANWQKGKICSQIQAWTLENDPIRIQRIKHKRTFRERVSSFIKGESKPKEIPKEHIPFIKEYWKNFIFIRDCFTENSTTCAGQCVKSINVVATVEANSISMPVYLIKFNNGLEIMTYSDFKKYFVSIISKDVLDIPMELIDNPSLRLFQVDCPGFKTEWIFAPYTENRKQFTTSINYSENQFFTFIFLLYLQLKNKIS